jgi:hypothetical protein
MSRVFRNCGHPVTPNNTHRSGNGQIRCATCQRERQEAIRRASGKPPRAVAAPRPCCKNCGERLGKHPAVTGLCAKCYRAQDSGWKGYRHHRDHALTDCIETASGMLLRALWREHPRILNHLAMQGSGDVRRPRG